MSGKQKSRKQKKEITMEQFMRDFELNWCRKNLTLVHRDTNKKYCLQYGKISDGKELKKFEEKKLLPILQEHYGSEAGGLKAICAGACAFYVLMGGIWVVARYGFGINITF